MNTNPAFMWKNGVFSNIKPPDSIPTPFVNANKISNSGVVVGSYQPESGGSGFALENGAYTKIDAPAGFEGMSMNILAVNKFDNVLAQATQISQQVGKTVLVQRILCSSVLVVDSAGASRKPLLSFVARVRLRWPLFSSLLSSALFVSEHRVSRAHSRSVPDERI